MIYTLPASCQIKVLDILYYEVFGEERNGRFVEIGAYDGESFSNTSGLADMGWQGLYVEPVPAYAARCRSRHRHNRVEVLNVAVARQSGRLRLAIAEGDTTAYPNGAQRANAEMIDVPAIPPAELADHRPAGDLDLLVLDCEGAEEEVLAAMDLQETWRPRMIILESRALNPRFDAGTRARSQAQLTRLGNAGWHVLWHDAINAVLIRTDLLRALGIDYERAGEAHLDCDHPAAAVPAFERAAEINPRNARAWAGLASARQRQDVPAHGEAAQTRARELDAPRYYQHAAKVALHTDELARARRMTEIADLLAPDAPDTALVAARLARADGNPAEAAARLQRALETDADRADLWAALADGHSAEGALPEAIDAAERAYRLDATPAAVQRLARLYLADGAADKAIALLERAVAANPRSPQHRHALSQAYEHQGDADAAQVTALAAARTAVADANLWLRSARLTRAPKARLEVYQEATAACPGSAQLHRAHAESLEAAGQLSDAYARLLEGVRQGCGQTGLADALARVGAPSTSDQATDT